MEPDGTGIVRAWRVTHESAENEGNLNIMFANGWEPFAVTQVSDAEGGSYPADIWLRRLDVDLVAR